MPQCVVSESSGEGGGSSSSWLTDTSQVRFFAELWVVDDVRGSSDGCAQFETVSGHSTTTKPGPKASSPPIILVNSVPYVVGMDYGGVVNCNTNSECPDNFRNHLQQQSAEFRNNNDLNYCQYRLIHEPNFHNRSTMMMNGGGCGGPLGLPDARDVAMETIDSSAPCELDNQQLGQAQQQQQQHPTAAMTANNKETAQMLQQLTSMSLNERRMAFAASKGKGVIRMTTSTPRITLTSADEDQEDENMMVDRCSSYDKEMLSPLDDGQVSPRFLAVPKLQEVGKERRPPTMVKSV